MKRRDFVRRIIVGWTLGTVLWTGHAAADGGLTILSINGPDGVSHDFDDAALAEIPWHEVQTHTVWTVGHQSFSGPYLSDVLSAVGWTSADLDTAVLNMRALNDFSVDVPGADAWSFRPILARHWNGAPMRIRDKGPIWLIYPRDDNPDLQDPLIDERWIWQLREIQISP